METHKIISVKIVNGNKLNPRWQSDMQVVVTDQDEFIDNMPGITFGHHHSGFDWRDCIGKTISNIKVIHNSGFKWLNRPPLNFTEIEALIKEKSHETTVKTATELLINTVTSTKTKKKGILILGATAIKSKHINGIAKNCGIETGRIEIQNDYSKPNAINIDMLVNCMRYDWLLIGPTAHSLLGLGDHSSLQSRLQKEKGPPFSYIILTDYSGARKITKEAIRKAFQKIVKEEENTKK